MEDMGGRSLTQNDQSKERTRIVKPEFDWRGGGELGDGEDKGRPKGILDKNPLSTASFLKPSPLAKEGDQL